MADQGDDGTDLALSYLALRQFLGGLGLALPVALYLYARVFGGVMQPSISDFYHTPMGDVLVGALWAIGIFLIAYRGYSERPKFFWFGDREASIIAGLAAIAIAVFPVSPGAGDALCQLGATIGPCPDQPDPILRLVSGSTRHPDGLHFGAALLFFAALAYFCLVLFPMGGRRKPDGSPALSGEHLTYYICGWTIVAMLVVLAVYFLGLSTETQAVWAAYNLVFWAEAVAIIAFALSWLAKGRFLQRPFGLRPGA